MWNVNGFDFVYVFVEYGFDDLGAFWCFLELVGHEGHCTAWSLWQRIWRGGSIVC